VLQSTTTHFIQPFKMRLSKNLDLNMPENAYFSKKSLKEY